MIARFLILPLACAVLVAPACATGAQAMPPREEPAEPRSILFIGNSLTATNDLPAMVCRMARMTDRPLLCESVLLGGASLDDHRARGGALQRIAEREWSVVVLQQGPSALPESRMALRASTAQFADQIRKSRAVPALYAVWPSAARSFDAAAVAESYRLAAEDTGGMLFPAGTAWSLAWKRDRSLPLYGADRFHPSAEGTYLAALVIHRRLFGDLPASLVTPSAARAVAGTELRLDARELRILGEAAEEAVAASEPR